MKLLTSNIKLHYHETYYALGKTSSDGYVISENMTGHRFACTDNTSKLAKDKSIIVDIDYKKIFLTKDNILFFGNDHNNICIHLNTKEIFKYSKSERIDLLGNLSDRTHITISNS
jgi:hypothetical protein